MCCVRCLREERVKKGIKRKKGEILLEQLNSFAGAIVVSLLVGDPEDGDLDQCSGSLGDVLERQQ